MKKDRFNELKQSIGEFSSNVSAHGISNLKRAKSKINFFFWLIFYLLMTSLSFYFLTRTVHDYLQYNVVSLNRYFVEKVVNFPSVAICHTNSMVTNDSIDFLADYISNKTNSSYEDTNSTKLDFVNKHLNLNPGMKYKVKDALMEMEPIEKEKFGFSIDQMIIKCRFGSIDCTDPTNFIIVNDETYGNCVVFNSDTTRKVMNGRKHIKS